MILHLLAFFLLSVHAENGSYPGQTAPDFTLKDLRGKAYTLSGFYKEGPVWLNLFTTWCPECKEEMPILTSVARSSEGVTFVFVSLQERESVVKAFEAEYKVPEPLLLDPDGVLANPYRIRQIPLNIGIAKGGQIRFRRNPVTSYKEVSELILELKKEGGNVEYRAPIPRSVVSGIFSAFIIFVIWGIYRLTTRK